MSNMPDIHKAILGVRLPLELLVRLRKHAGAEGVTVTELVQRILTAELDRLGIEADENDRQWIQERTRINEDRRHAQH